MHHAKEDPRTYATTGGFRIRANRDRVGGLGAAPAGLRGEPLKLLQPRKPTRLSQASPLAVSALTNCQRSANEEPQRSTDEGA